MQLKNAQIQKIVTSEMNIRLIEHEPNLGIFTKGTVTYLQIDSQFH